MLNSITLENIIALRLLSAKPEGETKANIKKLDVYFTHRLSKSAWLDCLDQALANLMATGEVEQLGKARYKLTAVGIQQNKGLLGYLPSNTQWQAVKNIDLMIYILQLPAPLPKDRRKLGQADGLRGAIIQKYYVLPISDYPTLTQARDALLWQHAFDPQRAMQRALKAKKNIGNRYTLTAASSIILNDLLGIDASLEPKNAVNQLVAKTVGAQKTDPNELRLALIRSALMAAESKDPAVDGAPFDLAAFAGKVNSAAQSCETGRFGNDKVFISHVYAHMTTSMPLQQFKQHLLMANNQRLLSLAQADLVPAMNQQDVAASEVCYLTSVFHFIRL